MTSLGTAPPAWRSWPRGRDSRFYRSISSTIGNSLCFLNTPAYHSSQSSRLASQFDLINKKKKDKKGDSYKNSGQIVVKSVKIEQVPLS
jgi:hypothetical protein